MTEKITDERLAQFTTPGSQTRGPTMQECIDMATELQSYRRTDTSGEAKPVAYLTTRGLDQRVVLAKFVVESETTSGFNGWAFQPLYAHPKAEVTDEMVERAARAICLAQGYKANELDDIGRISHLPLWMDKMGAAKAALTAALSPNKDG